MVHLACGSHFFARGLGYFIEVSSFCMQMPGIMHPTGLTAVYGCTSYRLWISPNLALSVLSLTEPREAPGWQAIAIDADVKQVITPWLQTLNNSVFTLEYKPWYHCGPNAEMVVVTTFRYDVYRLLHVPCIDRSYSNILTECLLPYCLKVLCIYIAV